MTVGVVVLKSVGTHFLFHGQEVGTRIHGSLSFRTPPGHSLEQIAARAFIGPRQRFLRLLVVFLRVVLAVFFFESLACFFCLVGFAGSGEPRNSKAR